MRVAANAALIAALLIVGLLAAPSWARPHSTPTPAPTPTPVADPAITKIARQQFVQWQAGTINKSLYAPQVTTQLTDARVSTTSQQLGELGALTDTVYVGRWINPQFPADMQGYIYQMRCTQGNVYLWMAIDSQGKIASFIFKNRFDVETVTPTPSATPTAP
jgi:hypothetical protein